MSDTTISPNMGLPVPTVGEDPGPDWATNLNASLSAIDSHNHSSGQGVPITPDGISINSDLSMNNNDLSSVRSVRFTPQSGAIADPTDLGCLYENGVDLYYIDGAGNQVRITQSGSVSGSAGTITGLPSGTASAAFAGSTFTFQSATATPAAMNVGSVKVSQTSASGKGVTISAAAGQAADFGMSLPAALPASTKIVSLDSSGNIGATYGVDNTSIEISSSNLQVKDGGITTAKIADAAVTSEKVAAPNSSSSSTAATFSTTSTSYVDVTNVTRSFTTTGTKPVLIMFMPDTTGASGALSLTGGATAPSAQFQVLRNSTSLGVISIDPTNQMSPSSLNIVDRSPTAGTVTYKLQVKVFAFSGTPTITITNIKMFLCEL